MAIKSNAITLRSYGKPARSKADEKREDPEGWEENYLPYLRRLIQP
jgi:hypothetical protein